jgi:hypothetical protein
MTRRAFLAVASAVAAAPLVVAASAHGQSRQTDPGLRAFQRSIDKYMHIRAAVERGLPRLETSSDPQHILAAAAARADALGRARADARQGDMFNAEVAALFRAHIHQTFAGRAEAVADLLREMQEDGPPAPPVVNGAFSWQSAVGTPPSIVAILPPLPDGVQYRFVGAALVLVDVDANLVLDILPDALPVRRAGWARLRDPLTTHR